MKHIFYFYSEPRTPNSLLITDTPSDLVSRPSLFLSVPSVPGPIPREAADVYASDPEPRPNPLRDVPSALAAKQHQDKEEVHKLQPWVQVA